MDEWREVWRASERHALGMSPRGDADADRYGGGVVIERLEARVAELLGKEAAVWMPSGTMAQQIALRIHADRSGRAAVAFHPTATWTRTRSAGTRRSTGCAPSCSPTGRG